MEISIYKRDQSHFALMKGWWWMGTGLACLPLPHPRTFSEAPGSIWNYLSKVVIGASLVAQKVKNLPAMRKTQVRSLGREDPLEKRMATHSSILAWRTLWTKEPGGLQSVGSQRVRHDWAANTFTLFTFKAKVTWVSFPPTTWELAM